MHIAGRGIDFSSELEYNDLDPEVHDYGRWTDSGDVELYEQPDGSVEFEDGGAYFVFLKQANGTYVTPAGIKAALCTAGNLPCPGTLPTGVKWRLIYNQSQEHIDFKPSGHVLDVSDRYANTLTPGYTEGISQITSWTDTQGRKIEYFRHTSTRSFTEVKDVAGGRHVSYEYEGSGANQELIAYTDANGDTTHYHYEFYDLNKITTPKGNVIKLVYDSEHRIKEIIRTTNAEHTTGPTTKYTYYALGSAPGPCTSKQKATVIKDPDWTASKAHETTYCSNVLDEVEKTVDAEGHETKATFDPVGNQISGTAAARETGGAAGVTSMVYGTGGQNLLCEVQGTSGEPKTECPSGAMSKGYSSKYSYMDTSFPFQASEATSARQKATNLCYWGGSHACTGTGTEGESGEGGALRRQTDALASQNSLNYSYNKTARSAPRPTPTATRRATNTTLRGT